MRIRRETVAILTLVAAGCESNTKDPNEVLEHFAITARLGQPVQATIQQYPSMIRFSDGSYEVVLPDPTNAFGFLRARTSGIIDTSVVATIVEITLEGRQNSTGIGVRRELETEIGAPPDRVHCIRLGENSTDVRIWNLSDSHVILSESHRPGTPPTVSFHTGRPRRNRFGTLSRGPC